MGNEAVEKSGEKLSQIMKKENQRAIERVGRAVEIIQCLFDFIQLYYDINDHFCWIKQKNEGLKIHSGLIDWVFNYWLLKIT